MELMVFLLQKGVCDEIGITAARLSSYCCQFWNTAVVKRSGDVTRLQALVKKKKIMISEAVIREILQLNDAEGVVCLPNEEIFTGLAQMGYEKPVGKGFSGVETPLFEGMLAVGQPTEEGLVVEQVQVDDVAAAVVEKNVAEDVSHAAIPSPPPHDISSLSQKPSSPPHQQQSSPQAPPQDTEFPTQLQQVLNVCSALSKRVENLETDNAAQKLVIVKLKARVKKLEKANKSKSSKLRRLRKDGASRRVESSNDMEDVFNQGRMIADMDMDEGIELVKDAEVIESEGRHAEKQAEIYNLDLDHSSKVLSMQEDDSEVQEVVEVVTTGKLITEVVTAAASQVSAASTTIPAASATIPAAKPTISAAAPPVVAAYTRRRKGVIITDPEEELPLKTPAETPKVKDKGKGILVETPKPLKKKDQIKMDAEYAKKLQEEINKNYEKFSKDIDWDAAMDYVNQKSKEMEAEDQEIIKSINETPAQKAAKRRKLSKEAQEAKDLRKRLKVVEDEDADVFVEATPLASKVPVVDCQIVLVDNKPRFKIIRADETHQYYISFTTLLKNFDREDLETLWRIVKDRFSISKPTNFLDEYLLMTLKTMFKEPDGQDAIWRNQKSVHGLALVKRWKLLASCGVHVITLLTVQLFLLVERSLGEDDILMFSLDEQSHAELLSKFYSLVTKYGIMLSEKKMEVGVTTIQLLGMEFSDGKYQPQPHVAQELLKFPDELSSQKMNQQFLGLINYMADFLPKLSHHTA
nr:polyprotein [Tanacetum cinerariifolium]